PGLSTIIDGIMTSRAIFQRMRSYSLYRITSTIHFLLFFFCVILALDWSLPAVLLIMIALLNDAATLAIAVDNTQISDSPDKWRIGQLITLSIIMGMFLTMFSFAHYFIFLHVIKVTPAKLFPSSARREKLAARRERSLLMKRIARNVKKMRKVLLMIKVISAFKQTVSERQAI
ncbi:21394_t:CDS:2, partial [Racocetra persica]